MYAGFFILHMKRSLTNNQYYIVIMASHK